MGKGVIWPPLEYQKAKFNLVPNESKISIRKDEWKAE
jgi:hypothetical protein